MKSIFLVSAIAASFFGVEAQAQQNLVGTWKVAGHLVGEGQSAHPKHSAERGKPSFKPVDLIATVEAQEGSNFFGTMRGPSGSTERFVGSINSSGQGVVVNGRGGLYQLTLSTPDKIQHLYTLGSNTYLVAASGTWERQPK